MAEVFHNESVHIVSIRLNTFVIFFFSHKQPESPGRPKLLSRPGILSYTVNYTGMLQINC